MNLLRLAADRIAASSRTVEARQLVDRLARLNVRDGFTLTHALQIAAERFDEDAKTMEREKEKAEAFKAANPGKGLLFHPEACDRLADQFRRQAADVRELLAVLEDDDDDEEEEEAAA
jgi:hypothetical protein